MFKFPPEFYVAAGLTALTTLSPVMAAGNESTMDIYRDVIVEHNFVPLVTPRVGMLPGDVYVTFKTDSKVKKKTRKGQAPKFKNETFEVQHKLCNLFAGTQVKPELATFAIEPSRTKIKDVGFLASLLDFIPFVDVGGGARYSAVETYTVNFGHPKVLAIPFDNPHSEFAVAEVNPQDAAAARKCAEKYDNLDKKLKKTAFVVMETVVVDNFTINYALNPVSAPAEDEGEAASDAGTHDADTGEGSAGSLTQQIQKAYDTSTKYGGEDAENKSLKLVTGENPEEAASIYANYVAAHDEPSETSTDTESEDQAGSSEVSAEDSGTGLLLDGIRACSHSGIVTVGTEQAKATAGWQVCNRSASSLRASGAPYVVGYKALKLDDIRLMGKTRYSDETISVEGDIMDEKTIAAIKSPQIGEEDVSALYE